MKEYSFNIDNGAIASHKILETYENPYYLIKHHYHFSISDKIRIKKINNFKVKFHDPFLRIYNPCLDGNKRSAEI